MLQYSYAVRIGQSPNEGLQRTNKKDRNAWIELYNPQNQAFDLYAAHAAIDTGSGTARSRLLYGTAIAAHGFFVIFPEADPFFPNTKKSLLRLLFNDVVIDQVLIPPALGYDQSYARIPDGGASWRVTSTPTIDASNTTPTVTPTPTRSTSTKTSTSNRQAITSGSTVVTTGTAPGNTDGQLTHSNGVQPSWSGLQMPSASASSPTTTAPAYIAPDTAPAAPVTDNSADVPRKIVLSSLAVVIAGAIFLCWRRFKPT